MQMKRGGREKDEEEERRGREDEKREDDEEEEEEDEKGREEEENEEGRPRPDLLESRRSQRTSLQPHQTLMCLKDTTDAKAKAAEEGVTFTQVPCAHERDDRGLRRRPTRPRRPSGSLPPMRTLRRTR